MFGEIVNLGILAFLGVVSGFLNVTAGGGSLLTLPFLIFLGLPANVANGTNRIAILVQNIFATVKFHQSQVIPKGLILATTLPAIAGSIIGAQIAVEIDELLFKRILAVVMLLVMAPLFFGKNPTAITERTMSSAKKSLLAFVFLFIGVFGGFIQAGIGFLIITTLTAAGYDLIKTNALKVLVILIFTPFALAVFIYNGQVDFLRGFVLAAGSAGGATIASKVVIEQGHDFIRWIVMAAVVVFAVKLFWG